MTTTPQDHQSRDFTYTFPSGKSVKLRRFAALMTFGRARKLRGLPEDEQMFTILESECDEATLAVLDEMEADQTEAFFKAWQADSGVSLGESGPSTA